MYLLCTGHLLVPRSFAENRTAANPNS
jgi:hypothetical protein